MPGPKDNASPHSNRLSFTESRKFTKRIERVIPGGAHTYSRGSDQFPVNAPNGVTRAKGARFWDVDGNCLVDWHMALFSAALGHAHPEVNQAVVDVIQDGVGFSRPAFREMEIAEQFLSILGGDMVKFAKHGSTVTTAAVKLARGFTGRAKVAVPIEHPFFSFDDWFIASTPANFGIPNALKNLTLQFSYNDLESLHALFRANPGEIACVIMEGVRWDPPHAGFLEGVRELCDKEGALLIIDEMINGMKMAVRGATEYFDVRADLTTWGKGLANGFSASALSGRAEIMELGGLEPEGKPKLFLVSTTHGAELSGLAAMSKTIDLLRDGAIIRDNWTRGEALRKRIDTITARHGLEKNLVFTGYPCLWFVETRNKQGDMDNGLKTLFMQELLACGVFFQGVFYMTPAHGDAEIEETTQAWDAACTVFREAIDGGSVAGLLEGREVKPVFRKTR
jgi:glutamate-1-semialdehyde 2,1-aminomutase